MHGCVAARIDMHAFVHIHTTHLIPICSSHTPTIPYTNHRAQHIVLTSVVWFLHVLTPSPSSLQSLSRDCASSAHLIRPLKTPERRHQHAGRWQQFDVPIMFCSFMFSRRRLLRSRVSRVSLKILRFFNFSSSHLSSAPCMPYVNCREAANGDA